MDTSGVFDAPGPPGWAEADGDSAEKQRVVPVVPARPPGEVPGRAKLMVTMSSYIEIVVPPVVLPQPSAPPSRPPALSKSEPGSSQTPQSMAADDDEMAAETLQPPALRLSAYFEIVVPQQPRLSPRAKARFAGMHQARQADQSRLDAAAVLPTRQILALLAAAGVPVPAALVERAELLELAAASLDHLCLSTAGGQGRVGRPPGDAHGAAGGARTT